VKECAAPDRAALIWIKPLIGQNCDNFTKAQPTERKMNAIPITHDDLERR